MKITNFTSEYFGEKLILQIALQKIKGCVREILCKDIVLKISFSPLKFGSCFNYKGRLSNPLQSYLP